MKPQAPRIHLAPAHPCMGWVSMNRYWQALTHEAAGDPDVTSLVTAGPVEAPGLSKWRRQWIRRVVYPWIIKTQARAGVLHILDHSFANLLAHARPSVRTVVTVHDLIPLTDPADLTPAQRGRFEKTVSWIPTADRVVCVSEHTRSEVQRLLKVPAEKMTVLPNGASSLPEPDSAMTGKLAALPPFIFSVGNARPRKNLGLLSPLVRHLAEQGISPTIVRAGARLDGSLASEIRRHAALHELGMVTDEELAAAYAQAALTLVPSMHEGFGLPVLEAMQAGCPVVYSLATSLPEVAGDAGLGFDPADAAQAAEQCRRVLSDAALRSRLVTAGRERAARFTWRSHWQGLQEIYHHLLDECPVS